MLFGLVSCANYIQTNGVNRHDNFISALIEYAPPQGYAAPHIEGFNAITDLAFDYAAPFNNGGYTFVIYNGINLLLDTFGKLYYAPENLTDKTLIADKYIFGEKGSLGVKNLFGNVIAPPEYEAIEIDGEIILAQRSFGQTDIFYKGARVHQNIAPPVYTRAGKYIVLNGFLHSVETLAPLTYNGYNIVSEAVNGMYTIADNALYGYVSESGMMIAPQFAELGNFNNSGYAYVVDTAGQYAIIDKQGTKIYAQNGNLRPVNFDGKILTFFDGASFGIADSNFNPLTQSRFHYLYAWTLFNGYAIYNPPYSAHRFYSTRTNGFVLGEYDFIAPFTNHFLAKVTDNAFRLYDTNLNEVISVSPFISFNGRQLLTRQNQKFHFYKPLYEYAVSNGEVQ
ncbi:MAG: hypothetical protein FWH03_05275 [Firmicutes bacterium]|nr:hypothetical protein [Bacillota bacterium]